MAVLVTAIHVLPRGKDVDTRDKPAQDDDYAIFTSHKQAFRAGIISLGRPCGVTEVEIASSPAAPRNDAGR